MIDVPVFFPSYYKAVMCTGGNKVALIAVSFFSFGSVRSCKNRDEFINYTVRVMVSAFLSCLGASVLSSFCETLKYFRPRPNVTKVEIVNALIIIKQTPTMYHSRIKSSSP